MRLPIGYRDAARRWPEAVEEIVAKLRKGKSAHRDADPASLDWSIEWCLQVRGYTFGEIINRDVLPPTPEEKAEENVKNSTAWLSAKKGRWSGQSNALKDLPQEVKDEYARSAAEERKEKDRVEALTPEERDKEVQNAIKTLRKYPGFTAIRVTKKGR